MGARYWHFNVNHLGQQDIEAQLDFIHTVKCAEVAAQPVQAAERRKQHQRCTAFQLCCATCLSALQLALSASVLALQDFRHAVMPTQTAKGCPLHHAACFTSLQY